MKYKVLSPDGFDISATATSYPSLKKAKEALKEWVGYYSQTCSNGYRRHISLLELADHCEITKI